MSLGIPVWMHQSHLTAQHQLCLPLGREAGRPCWNACNLPAMARAVGMRVTCGRAYDSAEAMSCSRIITTLLSTRTAADVSARGHTIERFPMKCICGGVAPTVYPTRAHLSTVSLIVFFCLILLESRLNRLWWRAF